MRIIFLILLLFCSNCFSGVIIKFGNDGEIPSKKIFVVENSEVIPIEIFYKLKNVRSVEIIDSNYHLCENKDHRIAKFNVDPKLKKGFVKFWLRLPCVNRTKKEIFLKIRIIQDKGLTVDQLDDYNFKIRIRFKSFYNGTSSNPGVQ